MNIPKTNVARLLDAKKINYQLVPYIVNENNLAATHIAEQLNENIEQVFKTLVIKGDKTGIIVCVIPGDKEVDLKKVAKISSNKKVEMIAVKDLLSTTGYIRGGCSPIGMKKKFPTWIHKSCTNYQYIFVSAGVRGLQLKINPNILIDYIEANIDDLIEELPF